jgi:membrane dipeptidase
MLALTWNHSNALGEGVNEAYQDGTPSSGGLTELGKSVILEMNRLGMVVDVSHLNETTFWDTMAITNVPVIASHSSVYSLNNNARNLKDDQIQAIAQTGGVIQVNFHRPFLAADPATVTIGTLVDHIDYIVQLVGIDSVGLGSDFDGAEMPDGLENAALLPRITLELVKRGYSDDAIRKILGANTARLFHDVSLQATGIKSSKNAPNISMDIEMGTRLDTATPTFSAIIQVGDGYALDLDRISLVIDGQVMVPDYDESTATASLTMTTPLSEQFHVVTFVAANLSGETTRKTRIFAINQP